MKYAIIDTETTGGNQEGQRIIDISIFIHDGTRTIDEFHSLINPQVRIPYNITQLTGISNEMVADAPKFFEIAKKIIEITQDCIFVAHNAPFDYGFVKREFAELGFTYRRNTLCTVKLSRKLLPKHKSYSLGNLCKDLGIVITHRHRAQGDAQATVQLFEVLLERQTEAQIFEENVQLDTYSLRLHPNIPKESIENLPEKTGVYYFYNNKNDVVYVGKSKNIRHRILSHFAGSNPNRKAMDMKNTTYDIGFRETGSELTALLLESSEIKTLQPRFNSAQRRTRFSTGIFCIENPDGYLSFEIQPLRSDSRTPLVALGSKSEAETSLQRIATRYQLCQKLCGLYKVSGACFHYHIKQCKGACCGQETAEEYNLRADKARRAFEYDSPNFVIIDKGRTADEKSVIIIENGKYLGFGFIEKDAEIYTPEDFKQYITPYNDNKDIAKIIQSYLKKNKVEKMIRF
jgi:DNA polymerase-3 subunit epsilon